MTNQNKEILEQEQKRIWNKQNLLLGELASHIEQEQGGVNARYSQISKMLKFKSNPPAEEQSLRKEVDRLHKFRRLTNSLNINYSYLGVSRDALGHPLVFRLISEENSNCYALEALVPGYEISTREPCFECVSYVNFYYTLDNVREFNISLLGVQENFKGAKIGRTILQFLENYSVDKNISHILLNSEFSRAKLDEVTDFDKNLYFYMSQGYKFCGKVGLLSKGYPLKKQRLSKVALDYGFNAPLVKFDKHDKKFAMNYLHSEVGYDDFNADFSGKNMVYASNFQPITLTPNENSLKKLRDFASQFEQNIKLKDY